MKIQAQEEWDFEIKAETPLINFDFKGVWLYRDLLALLVRRDFVSVYKQTILGPIWFFIQPIFTMITFTFVFGNLAGIATDGLPKPLFYLAGITAWGYFSDCLNKVSNVFRANAGIFGKVYFPRLIMPLSIVISNLIKFGIQLLLFCFLIAYYHFTGVDVAPGQYILLFPLLVILMAFQGLGLGMIISSLTTKYRDLAFFLSFAIQLLMYATPVIYPLSEALIKYPDYAWLITYNPMTPIIEGFRLAFLGQGSFDIISMLYCIGISILLLFSGIIIFNRVERTFIDTV